MKLMKDIYKNSKMIPISRYVQGQRKTYYRRPTYCHVFLKRCFFHFIYCCLVCLAFGILFNRSHVQIRSQQLHSTIRAAGTDAARVDQAMDRLVWGGKAKLTSTPAVDNGTKKKSKNDDDGDSSSTVPDSEDEDYELEYDSSSSSGTDSSSSSSEEYSSSSGSSSSGSDVDGESGDKPKKKKRKKKKKKDGDSPKKKDKKRKKKADEIDETEVLRTKLAAMQQAETAKTAVTAAALGASVAVVAMVLLGGGSSKR